MTPNWLADLQSRMNSQAYACLSALLTLYPNTVVCFHSEGTVYVIPITDIANANPAIDKATWVCDPKGRFTVADIAAQWPDWMFQTASTVQGILEDKAGVEFGETPDQLHLALHFQLTGVPESPTDDCDVCDDCSCPDCGGQVSGHSVRVSQAVADHDKALEQAKLARQSGLI